VFESRATATEFLDRPDCHPALAAASYRFMETVNCHFGGIRIVRPGLDRTETRFDVAQALSIGELRKRHAEILIPARQSRGFVITVIARHAGLEFLLRDVGHQLSKDGAASQHPALWRRWVGALVGPLQRASRKDIVASVNRGDQACTQYLRGFADSMTGHYCSEVDRYSFASFL